MLIWNRTNHCVNKKIEKRWFMVTSDAYTELYICISYFRPSLCGEADRQRTLSVVARQSFHSLSVLHHCRHFRVRPIELRRENPGVIGTAVALKLWRTAMEAWKD